MLKHTPGPWAYHFEEPNRKWALVMSGGKAGVIVANVNTESCPDTASAPAFRVMPAEANAQLIAAAPDLLRALEQIHNNAEGRKWNSLSADRGDMDSWQSIAATAKAAIAKAKGVQS